MVTKFIRQRPARIYYIDLNFIHVKSKERRTNTNSFISKICKNKKPRNTNISGLFYYSLLTTFLRWQSIFYHLECTVYLKKKR